MRGVTAANLLTMLKAELGHSLTAGVGTDTDTMLTYQLDMQYQLLAAEWEWPFLKKREEVTLVAGDYTYTFPSTISTERAIIARASWSGIWRDIRYGIGEAEWNLFSSTNAIDPIQAWEMSGASEFTVWPTPVTGQTLAFTGTQALTALTTEGATCLLDAQLVALFAAAQVLLKYEEKHAALKLAQAQNRLQRLFAQYPRRNPVWNLNAPRRFRRWPTVGGQEVEAEGLQGSSGTIVGSGGVIFGSGL